jgi:hypothetical protein
MSFRKTLNSIQSTAKTVSTGLRLTNQLGQDFKSGNVGRILRTGSNLLGLFSGSSSTSSATASFPSAGDWRVRLSMPGHPLYSSSPVLSPIRQSNGLVWPYTPTVSIIHSAQYNPISHTHTNYPFQAYRNSTVDQINVTGQFYVETEEEGRYWVAMLHFLRSVTKMAYGNNNGDIQGSPPPVMRFSGYGDYVFNNTPVVVQQFTIDLSPDTDYIGVSVDSGAGSAFKEISSAISSIAGGSIPTFGSSSGQVYVPVSSMVSVTLLPAFSRREQAKFSLKDFVNGGLVKGGGYI